ncbi:MAG: hypothetical protein NC323_05850 [Oxalobacter formigenes]|nr:hypothetical protein [Oxalobacter formigenes]
MKKYLACSLLLLAVPLMGKAACTEEALAFKREKALYFRVYALQGQHRLPVYSQLASELGREFSTLYALYQKDKSAGQTGLDQLCSVMDQMIAIADDLLAGGNGLEKQTPWVKYSPEDFLNASTALTAHCAAASSACETGEGREIMEELAQLSHMLVEENNIPAKLVDKYYERIMLFLKTEKQPETPQTD